MKVEAEARAAALGEAAADSMRRRDVQNAKRLLDEAVALTPDDPALWLRCAAVHRACGTLDEALAAVEKALALAPRAFPALLMRGSLVEKLQGPRAAGPAYGAALAQAPPENTLDDATARALAHARQVNLTYGAELNAALRASLDELSLPAASSRNSLAFVDLLTGRRRNYRQEPLGYFFPGLPAIEFWDRAHFPWLEALEARTEAIRAEMLAVGYEDDALRPYMDLPDHEPVDQWVELNRSLRWTAFHLMRRGHRIEENCDRCPATLAALALTSQPTAPNRSPAAMFSVLKPRTPIPSHTGVSNTRLVAHLALDVPSGCGFRVGAETRAWVEGEAWVFDDTIEHEAWNDSDKPRGVLIFDVEHPLIPEDEREAIRRIMGALDAFNGDALEDL